MHKFRQYSFDDATSNTQFEQCLKRKSKKIGEGGYCSVYHSCEHNGNSVIKHFTNKISKEQTQDFFPNSFIKECCALRQLQSCAHIVKIQKCYISNKNHCIQLQKHQTDVEKYFNSLIKDGRKQLLISSQPNKLLYAKEDVMFVKKPTLAKFTMCMVDALLDLHSNNIVHQDIKPSNVLVNLEHNNEHFHLCDFNSCLFYNGKEFSNLKDQTMCTFVFRHRSILQQNLEDKTYSDNMYSYEIDLWSTACCLLYSLFNGNTKKHYYTFSDSKVATFIHFMDQTIGDWDKSHLNNNTLCKHWCENVNGDLLLHPNTFHQQYQDIIELTKYMFLQCKLYKGILPLLKVIERYFLPFTPVEGNCIVEQDHNVLINCAQDSFHYRMLFETIKQKYHRVQHKINSTDSLNYELSSAKLNDKYCLYKECHERMSHTAKYHDVTIFNGIQLFEVLIEKSSYLELSNYNIKALLYICVFIMSQLVEHQYAHNNKTHTMNLIFDLCGIEFQEMEQNMWVFKKYCEFVLVKMDFNLSICSLYSGVVSNATFQHNNKNLTTLRHCLLKIFGQKLVFTELICYDLAMDYIFYCLGYKKSNNKINSIVDNNTL